MKNPKAIIITGASSGIGQALAKEYAQEGVNIHINGRSKTRLNITKKACERKGANCYIAQIDVTNEEEMHNWIESIFAKEKKIDLIIANAGISSGTSKGHEKEQKIRETFDVNLNGVLNTILPAVNFFVKQKSGQIAIISSMAGFRGLASCPAYSASKGAIRIYGEALRADLARDNIQVSVINPGFVKSRITTKNKFPMPFFMKSDYAAKIIRNRLTRNIGRISFPFLLYFPSWFMMVLPDFLANFISIRLPKK